MTWLSDLNSTIGSYNEAGTFAPGRGAGGQEYFQNEQVTLPNGMTAYLDPPSTGGQPQTARILDPTGDKSKWTSVALDESGNPVWSEGREAGGGNVFSHFVKDVGKNFVLPALMAYGGVSALGAMSAAGAGAGGLSAAETAAGYDALAGGGMATAGGGAAIPWGVESVAGGSTVPWGAETIAGGAAASSPWSSIAKLFSGGGSTAGAMMPWGSASNLMNMGSGIYGMYEANRLKKLAAGSDPWGTSGGAAMAGDQLKTLMQDPSGVTKLPGYEAGLQAVQRSMAAQGYQGSGNMMAALHKYGGDFYNNAITQLSGLARTGGAQAQLPITGTAGAIDIAGRSLASLGYGTQMAQPGQMNPQQLLLLKQQLGIQ